MKKNLQAAADEDSDDDNVPSESSSESYDEFEEDDSDVDNLENDNDNIDHDRDDPVTPQQKQSKSQYPKKILIRTLLLLAIKLRHFLTDQALEDIAFVTDILPSISKPLEYTSKYHMQQIINQFSIPIQIHHFCPNCHLYAGVEIELFDDSNVDQTLECIECKIIFNTQANRQSGNIFMYLSLSQQLKAFYEIFHTDQLYSNTRKKQNQWAVEDIFDGTAYETSFGNQRCNNIISINFSIDGTPLFKSSQTSVTPILCTINELHPNERKRNIMLVSVFLGNHKPEMNEYVKPFVAEMKILSDQGFHYTYNGRIYHKKCKVMAGITDSVERPELRCTTTFRGVYGCGLYKHPGIEKPKGKGSVRVYPLSKDGEAFGEGLRTHNETLHHAETGKKGVRRRSNFCDIPGFNIIEYLPADWMHNVALGVVRQFTNIWFDPKNKEKDFYFIHLLSSIDDFLTSIKPSLDISRTPRKLSERKHWKAHEWTIWLLFYSLPIMKSLFPNKYVKHWSYLVDGISILLKTSISKAEIQYARNCLFQFIHGVEVLYGVEHISFNVNLLSHLPHGVELFGPLWSHSAFMYGDFHQQLKKFVRSSNAANLQILRSFRSKFAFHKMYERYRDFLTNSQRVYLKKVLSKRSLPAGKKTIDNIRLIGRKTCANLTDEQFLALQRINIPVERNYETEFYKRIVINNELIVSEEYTRVKKRNSYTVLLTTDEIFEINTFIAMEVGNKMTCFALGTYFAKCPNNFFPDRKVQHIIFIKKYNFSNVLAAVDVQMVKQKVTIVSMPDKQVFLACKHPNRFELLT